MSAIANKINKLEKFLKTLKLNKKLQGVHTVEMDLNYELNPMNDFDDLFYKQGKYLTYDEFFEYYVRKHGDLIKKTFKNWETKEFSIGLEARLYRTLSGLLTEYHAFLVAQKVFGEKNVIRDPIADKMGVDFVIKYKKKVYNIHIFIDSEQSWKFRLFKSHNKRAEQLDGFHVNFPYTLTSGRFNSVKQFDNGFGAYTYKYVKFLQKKMDEGKILNNNIIGTGITDFLYSRNQSSLLQTPEPTHFDTSGIQ